MKKVELDTKLNNLFTDEKNLLAEIYFILSDGKETKIRLADLEGEAQRKLTQEFIGKFKEDIIQNEDLSLRSISDADDRKNVIYKYDLEEVPQELNVIDHIIENEDLPNFSFKHDELNQIKGIMILIESEGQNLVVYKKQYPINLYRKDSGTSLWKSSKDERFTNVKEDIVKIYTSFEFFKLDETLFINDLKALEKFFGFHDAIKKQAENCIERIEEAKMLEDSEVLREMLEDIAFARKLTKAGGSSPVLGVVPNSTIVKFVEQHPALTGKIDINETKTKLRLTTKKSKQLFVKLLNDDYLKSELTTMHYDSLAKDAVEESLKNYV